MSRSIRRAARDTSAVGRSASLRTIFFHSFCSGRNVTQGDSTSTNENPGCRTACTITSASAFGSPVNARAMKFAPDASATTIGWNSRRPVPSGDSFESQSGSVVGEGWPFVMP